MKVIISAAAESELEAIADYIALDSKRRAASFVNELVDAALALTDTPLAYELVSGFETSGVRRKPYKRYVIFYRVEVTRIVVLHILNGAEITAACYRTKTEFSTRLLFAIARPFECAFDMRQEDRV